MIKNCFKDTVEFEKDVYIGDEKIATIKAFSRTDRAYIEKASSNKQFIDGEIVTELNYNKMEFAMVFRALKSWEFDREITEHNVDVLEDEYFNAISKAVQEMEKGYSKNKEGIVKNLKKQSG